MPTATITKTFRFEAAHRLPHHDGQCARPHGHSYRVEVVLAGPIRHRDGDSDQGMVRDFADVSHIWKTHAEPYLDHQDLNTSIGIGVRIGSLDVPPCWPTTAENIAVWLLRVFESFLPETRAVRVWETATSHAIVTVDDLRHA